MTNIFHVAVLAQLVERMAFNHVVVGSIPTDGDFFARWLLFEVNLWTFFFFKAIVGAEFSPPLVNWSMVIVSWYCLFTEMK